MPRLSSVKLKPDPIDDPEIRFMKEPAEFVPNAEYEREIWLQSKNYKLAQWILRRIDLILGVSPYAHLPRRVLPKEHFGDACWEA